MIESVQSASLAGTDQPPATLVERMQRRDQAALGELYDRTVTRVHALARRIVRNDADAEEVTVDVYAQAWESAARFDPERGNVMAWLFNLCRSRALDLVRRRAVRQGAEQGLAAEPLAVEADAGPEDLLAIVETGTRVHAALGALAPDRRQVLGLAYLRGYTQEEIAAFTGLPLGTVKSHMRRALGELRERLGGDAPEARGS